MDSRFSWMEIRGARQWKCDKLGTSQKSATGRQSKVTFPQIKITTLF